MKKCSNALAAVATCLLLSACGSADIEEQSRPADNTITLQDFCAVSECRRNAQVHLRTEREEISEILPLFWPVVQGRSISVLPGEKLYIEIDMVNGEIGDFRSVDHIVNAERTLTLEFTQPEGGLGMMLSVKNPFDQPLKYHIDMVDFTGYLHQTSSCPVVAGGGVFESWPHPIPELRISGLHFLEEGGSFSCEY